MADRRSSPTSTYRLQLHAGFTFGQAAEVVPYVARLGVSHLYLSPVLQAAPGSMHGYDVVDHAAVSDELGGEAGLLDLADTSHRHGLGIVVDVVPNHMAIPEPEHLNPQLWDVLRDGRNSPFAHWFDVEWDRLDGRLGLPILGGPVDDLISEGELRVDRDRGEPVLRYGDHVLPVAPGTETCDIATLLSRQHYLLADWHEKARILNYRRFFDVDTLIAVRVELDDVFDATHALLLGLHSRGVIDGFRIDHPDGLADPQGYLERLRDRVGDAWVVVEKILEPAEELPAAWQCAGTTGYDAIRAIQGALAPRVAEQLDARWRAVGGEPSYDAAELAAKRLVVKELFSPEIARLTDLAVAAARDFGLDLSGELAREGLEELLAHVQVYRAYFRLGVEPDADSMLWVMRMCNAAEEAAPELTDVFDTLRDLMYATQATDPATRDFVIRFQQVCGPVMAKGVEDTTYYRWHRMVGLNEVGGDPRSLDKAQPGYLHGWAKMQMLHHPLGMTTFSTHDTKRSEDVRARLLALAEDHEGWDAVTGAVLHEAADCGVDEPTAYFLAQTLMGAWPISRERLGEYLQKAVREAKQHTSWNDPDQEYEARVGGLVPRCLAEPVTGRLEAVLTSNAPGIRATTLAGKLLQLTMPGVPDVYQGTELVTLSLVDPDNRRQVDYGMRQAMLDRLEGDGPSAAASGGLDMEKLWVTYQALSARARWPELFGADASYEPLAASTPHVLGFVRADRLATVVTRWPRRPTTEGWDAATVALPSGSWTDVLTGERHAATADGAPAEALFARLPVALLLRGDP